ncbi:MAG TPA: cytochrome-c oxidase, cbb3-type subunit III [Steroidobacteraceae bacterium]|nr:cytochrome-c oxidase, cbb3-type subunit III [Steroidobacteraceae bacterium]
MNAVLSTVVTAVILLNIGGVMWLLWWTSRNRGSQSQAPTTGHVWDGDLREYNNPLPRWWLWLFVITVVFGLAYLLLYPGLGNYPGLKGWTRVKQYQSESANAEAVLRKTFAPFAGKSVQQLMSDPGAVRIGRNLFLNNCAGCHGSDARGAPGFPNLTDRDWLWGGSPETVLTTIREGRAGVMPAWGTILGTRELESTVAYVLTLSGRTPVAGDVAEGKAKFEQLCVACHGADGRGNQQLGAPNLTDSTWLVGGSVDTIRHTIAYGHQGAMPAHGVTLGDTRTSLLAAYVLTLGNAPP